MKPKIEPYGVDSKKKVQEITKKFEWKKWSIPIILLGVIIVGGVFSLFAKESEDRYVDLKINEEQRVVENEGGSISVGTSLDVLLGSDGLITILPLVLVAIAVIVPLMTLFGRRRF